MGVKADQRGFPLTVLLRLRLKATVSAQVHWSYYLYEYLFGHRQILKYPYCVVKWEWFITGFCPVYNIGVFRFGFCPYQPSSSSHKRLRFHPCQKTNFCLILKFSLDFPDMSSNSLIFEQLFFSTYLHFTVELCLYMTFGRWYNTWKYLCVFLLKLYNYLFF